MILKKTKRQYFILNIDNITTDYLQFGIKYNDLFRNLKMKAGHAEGKKWDYHCSISTVMNATDLNSGPVFLEVNIQE